MREHDKSLKQTYEPLSSAEISELCVSVQRLGDSFSCVSPDGHFIYKIHSTFDKAPSASARIEGEDTWAGDPEAFDDFGKDLIRKWTIVKTEFQAPSAERNGLRMTYYSFDERCDKLRVGTVDTSDGKWNFETMNPDRDDIYKIIDDLRSYKI